MRYPLEGFTKKSWGDDSFLVNIVSANVEVNIVSANLKVEGSCTINFNYEIRGKLARNSSGFITYKLDPKDGTGHWIKNALPASDEIIKLTEAYYKTQIENAYNTYEEKEIVENYKANIKKEKEIRREIEAYQKLPEIKTYLHKKILNHFQIKSVIETRSSSMNTGYHVHIYFDHGQNSEKLAKLLVENAKSNITISEIIRYDKLVGPHTKPNYALHIKPEGFSEIVGRLLFDSKGLSILVHAESGDDERDHAERTMWIGKPVALNMDYFKK